MDVLVISERFNGPPDSANGGYTCGRLACLLEGTVEVTLRRPPPLGKELTIAEAEDGLLKLLDGDSLVAQARSAELELEVPPWPGFPKAESASQRYVGHRHHPFPTCFVCGPQRDHGLRIFAGAVDEGQVAAVWQPAPELADDQGWVRPEYLWCALDCPGAFAVDQHMENPRVLGRLTGTVVGRLPAGQPAGVLGWSLGLERRKAFAGTAVFDAQGSLVAKAKAVWIAI